MRLFLSSENVGKYPDELIKLVGYNKKVAYVGNAKDFLNPEERANKVLEHKSQFESLGFDFYEFDLREYFENKITKKDLDGFGLVWCSGGNTFLLRRALKDSGFDKVLSELVKNNKITYGGSSAGAILATPSLRGVETGDAPDVVKQVYGKEIAWEGLGFVDFYIVPHYESDWFGAEAQKMVEYFQDNNLEFTALRDGQVVLVDGERHETKL